MSSLSPERREELAVLIRRNLRRYFTDVDNGPEAVVDLLAESNLLRGVLAAEREAGASGVRARVEALAAEWERSEDRAWVASCGDQLRAALNGGE